MLNLWRNVREAHYEAVREWGKGKDKSSIVWLQTAIKRTEVLIDALRKEEEKDAIVD